MRLQKVEESIKSLDLKKVFETAILLKGGKCADCPLNLGFQTQLPPVCKVIKITPEIVTVRVCCKQYPSPVKPVTGKVCKRLAHAGTKKTLVEWKKIQEQKAVASAHLS